MKLVDKVIILSTTTILDLDVGRVLRAAIDAKP